VNRTFRLLGLPLVVVALLFSVVPAASAWEPRGGAIFNNPKGNHAAQFKIVNSITRAVQGVPKGETIMMSAYMFDNGGTFNALVAAHRRGAHVQMVLDTSHARNGKTKRLARIFNRDNVKGPQPARWGKDQSFVVFCKQACRGKNGYNHTKFYAFSKSGTASNVIMFSSSNPNAGGALKGYNDMYVMKEKPALWAGVTKVMASMAQDTANDGDRFQKFTEGNTQLRFYPKRTGTHPILQDLNQVRCAGGTSIHVSMFRWNRKWGMAIARKLVGLAHNGCNLDIIYGAPSRQVRLYLTNAARGSRRISLWDSRYDRNGDGQVDLRVHHKYLLINGTIGGNHNATYVTAGSQNWGASLRTSDENTVTIRNNPSAYRAYLNNWTMVRNNSADFIGRMVGGRVG
jgi:hypothetical protein